MVHEISEFDIPDHQLVTTNAHQRAATLMDIGEAKITRSIFGRARVRVIRERDKKRRAWLLMALAVMIVAAAGWKGWIVLQQMLSAAPPLPLSERIRVGAPVFQSGDISVTTPSARERQKTPTQMVLDNMATRREPPPQPLGLKASRQMAVNPVTASPLTASQPQTAPLATNNAPKNQAGMQQPARPADSIQPAVPAVAAPPATQPAANRPAAVTPLAEPMLKEDTSTLILPEGANQPPGPVKAQP